MVAETPKDKPNYKNGMVKTFFMSRPTIPKMDKPIYPSHFPEKAYLQTQGIADTKFLHEDKFYDKEFPKTWESVYGFCGSGAITQRQAEKLDWIKPNYIFKGKDYDVFKDEIGASDIRQGALSDCYFLSAAAALASNPKRIQRLFSPQKKNSYGCYSVFLNVFGVWEEVVLDHRFPCEMFTKKLWFSGTENAEMWPLLLEKAYAKIHGGYANIAWGIARHA
jgi:hypothetical protein